MTGAAGPVRPRFFQIGFWCSALAWFSGTEAARRPLRGQP